MAISERSVEVPDRDLWDDTPAVAGAWRRHTAWAADVVRGAFATLKARITLAVVAALVLSTGIVSALSIGKAERDLKRQAEIRELTAAAHLAANLSARVVAVQNALRTTADAIDPVLETMDDGLEQFFNGQPAVRQMFANLFVADAGGRMRLLIDANGAHRPPVSLADRAYFRRVVAEMRPLVSDPVPGRVSGEPVIVFCHPIVRDGRVTTVIGGAIRLSSRTLRASLLDRDPAGETDGTVAVTFGPGLVLEHPDARLLTRPLREDASFDGAVADWMQQGSPLEPTGVHVRQAGQVVSVAGVAGTSWAVWRALPDARLYAPLEAVRREVVRDAVVVIGLLSALALLLIHGLLRPLTQLERRARSLFEPDGTQAVAWPAERGEVGQLVRALRHVAAERTQLERFSGELLGKLGSVMAAAPIGIAFTRFQKFELVSRAWCKLLGRDESELLGAPASIAFADAEDYAGLGAFVADAFARDGRYEGEWTFVRKDGSQFWGLLSGQPVERDNPAAGTIWTLADVTATRETRQSLEWSATHDALTGLLNRKGFERRLAAAAARQQAVLIAIDLDRFKPINDTHGHAAGDAVLRAVAAAIAGRIRAQDSAVRLGGDEFAVILENCPVDAGLRVAEGLLDAICRLAVPWGDATLTVGASVGVAPWSFHFIDGSDWAAAADAACYAAKAAGRGTVRMAGPLVAPAHEAAVPFGAD